MAWSCPVEEAQSRCTYQEFREWRAFYDLDPFGEDRADLRMAISACVAAKVAGSKRAKPADFMPEFDRQETDPSRFGQVITAYADQVKTHVQVNRKA